MAVWAALWRQQHEAGFAVAAAVPPATLDALRHEIDRAIRRGETLDRFRARVDRILGGRS